MAAAKKSRKKRRRRHLAPESLLSKRFKSDIRTAFINSGFEHIPTRGCQIEIAGRAGEFDSIFICQNVLVIAEDTARKQSFLPDHVRAKHDFASHLERHDDELFVELYEKFPAFSNYFNGHQAEYDWSEYVIRFIYCSVSTVTPQYQSRYGSLLTFIDYAQLKYLLSISKAIRRSARHELLSLLSVDIVDVGIASSSSDNTQYDGLLLPSAPSGFPKDHKLVTFLVDPAMLLEQAYVLRSDSWRDSDCLYQRLLIKNKIESMRHYLAVEGRVYVNNIIATLPEDTRLIELPRPAGRRRREQIRPIRIEIPRRYNSIGLVDGQHRVYSYHEGTDADKHEPLIATLRRKQHLLVTGVRYPSGLSKGQRQRFEAQLFLEINDKQKRVKSDLRQAIKLIVEPYSPVAIAKAVISSLGSSGPLAGELELHFYDTGKIKTASIVSYGLSHIVGLTAEHSFIQRWAGPGKRKLKAHKSKDALQRYVNFCAKQLVMFVSAFKEGLPDGMWTNDKKVSRVLTTTTMNGLVFCVRRLIEHDKLGDFEYYRRHLRHMDIDFEPDHFDYKSSHWKDLGEDLYACFC